MKGIDVSIQAITNKGSGVEENHNLVRNTAYKGASRILRKCFVGNVEDRNPDPKTTIFGDVSRKPKLYRFMCFDLKNTKRKEKYESKWITKTFRQNI